MVSCSAEGAGGLSAQECHWAQQDRHPGLVMPPNQAPAPLIQIADTRSIFPEDKPRPLQRAHMHAGLLTAAEMPRDEQPYADECDRPGPFKSPASTTRDPPKTMQLWRDVVSLGQISFSASLLLLAMACRIQPCCSSNIEPPRRCSVLHADLPWRAMVLLSIPVPTTPSTRESPRAEFAKMQDPLAAAGSVAHVP